MRKFVKTGISLIMYQRSEKICTPCALYIICQTFESTFNNISSNDVRLKKTLQLLMKIFVFTVKQSFRILLALTTERNNQQKH